MVTVPAVVPHAILPETLWSLPSTVTLAEPWPPETHVPPLHDLWLEQPTRPATTMAAPATATNKPRFTTLSFVDVVRPRSADHRQEVWCSPSWQAIGLREKAVLQQFALMSKFAVVDRFGSALVAPSAVPLTRNVVPMIVASALPILLP